MSTYDVDLPAKCSLCGIGELERVGAVGLIGYDVDTGELDIKSLKDIGIVPAHILMCNHCGNLILLSATKIQM